MNLYILVCTGMYWFVHLESVEVGYSDIFLEYSIYLTTSLRSESGILVFQHIPGICQPISHTRYMSRICLTYSFRVISSLCLEYSRHIPRIFFPSHLVICLEYTWIIPLLAAAMRLGCHCCHSTRILGVKGV